VKVTVRLLDKYLIDTWLTLPNMAVSRVLSLLALTLNLGNRLSLFMRVSNRRVSLSPLSHIAIKLKGVFLGMLPISGKVRNAEHS
jgi:hypothetical protein